MINSIELAHQAAKRKEYKKMVEHLKECSELIKDEDPDVMKFLEAYRAFRETLSKIDRTKNPELIKEAIRICKFIDGKLEGIRRYTKRELKELKRAT